MIGVAIVSLLDNPDLDTTRLWHMRLGNMSERGLHVLSKVYFVARKQKRVTFVNIVFLANNTEFLFVHVFTELKAP